MTDRNDDPAHKDGEGGQKPDSTGTNSRPRNETISQTGPGLPDETSSPVEITPDEEKNIEDSIRSM